SDGQSVRRRTDSTQTVRRQPGDGLGGRRQPESGRSASRQTAAAEEGGLSPRLQAQIRRKKKRRRMITMIVAECIALIFIGAYGFVARTMAKMQRPENFKIEELETNDLNSEVVERMKGYWTIAVFGVDSRGNAVTKGTNADVNILCNVNRDTGEIRLVSVYRDTYLNVSTRGEYNKLNYAYASGGPEQAVETLNRNLDLKIDDYMTFNWKAVANAIDILGGVDIELSKAEFYYINSFITETVKATGIGSHQLTHAGMNHLDGVQAVAYGRLRLMDTDFARTERQRKVIEQAFQKAKQADFQTLYVLIGTVFPQTSTSIGVDDLVANAKNISKFHIGETSGFPQQRGDANMQKKGAVVVPATLESNVTRLHQFLFGDENYSPSETVMNISAKIKSDTGIYQEGQFVDKVGTSGGVIQPPKTTEAEKETTSKAKDEEEGYQYIYETDEDGDRVRRRVKLETDEDGEYIYLETDEDGYLLEERETTRATTAATDENGNPAETGRGWLYPVETDENGDPVYQTDITGGSNTRPWATQAGDGNTSRPGTGGESVTGSSRPGATVPSGTTAYPGSTTAAGTTAAGSSRPGAAAGTTAAGTAGAGTNRPGSTESGTSTLSPTAPGAGTGITPTSPATTAAATESVRPTAPAQTEATGAVVSAPGSAVRAQTEASAGPSAGNFGSQSSQTSGTGVVAGPGQ
ncbi:MAG: LCP family protein, partial [Eubacteriales bacterium]|nr:LCP family protein [Eubacteriales bacterium]